MNGMAGLAVDGASPRARGDSACAPEGCARWFDGSGRSTAALSLPQPANAQIAARMSRCRPRRDMTPPVVIGALILSCRPAIVWRVDRALASTELLRATDGGRDRRRPPRDSEMARHEQ